MPRRESEQAVLFETYLCQVGSIRAYVKNIRELVRLLAPGDRDIARSIDRNAALIATKAEAAIATHSEFADSVGYTYLRDET